MGKFSQCSDCYENALRQSVAFYYFLNNLNKGGGYVNLPAPSSADVEAWVSSSSAAYTGSQANKLASIYTQKWVHFGVLQSTEAWSEYRRTGFPVLTFPSDGKLSGYDTPPTRLIYPSQEKILNSVNYEAVQAKDTRKTKIFWQQ
ncbi:SusD/RagB family nutrient-binding outer membrane lipoprotein [Pedobacter sp. NJ-S-72]